MRVPKLFLQPLLENSIIHGFKDMETGGHIVISGRDKGEYLEFQVSDNGCGIAQDVLDTLLDPQDSSRIGLANVHRRIQLIYGDQYGLVVRSAVGRGTTIIARIAKNNADT